MPKLKKSLLITLDFPPRFGGVAGYYYNICKNLPADKIVVLAPAEKNSEEFDLKQNFPIIRSVKLKQIMSAKSGLLNISSKINWLALTKEIIQIAKNHQIELIQIGQVLPLGTVALMLKRRTGLPFIFYSHGMDILVPQKIARKKIILKKIIKESQAIISNSHFTRSELGKLGADKNKIAVVYPCPNISSSHVDPLTIDQFLKEYELKNKKIILTVGRLVERKGHNQVIKALPNILKRVPNTVYLIAGDGPNKDKLEKLVFSLKLGQSVKFINQVSNNLLATLYQICDVFVMPSRHLPNGDVEGFGMVYLEANLFGKPVIGGKSGGISEAILNEKTGLLVNPNDTFELSQAIISILVNDSFAHTLGIQGMQRVHDDFDWKTQVDILKNILI